MQTKRGLLAGLGAIVLAYGAAIGIAGTVFTAEYHATTNGSISRQLTGNPKLVGDIVMTSERARVVVIPWFIGTPYPSLPGLFKMCSRGC
jgi:hypothetical protein